MNANPEGIKALVAKWRQEADQAEVNSLEAESIGFQDAAISSARYAATIRMCADELESLTAVAGDAEVVARELLAEELFDRGAIGAAGSVERGEGTTIDSHLALRAITRALNTRQAVEGMVPGEVFGMKVVHNPTLPPDGFVLVPRGEAERLVKVLRYAAHPQPSPHGDYLAGLIAAAAPQAGKGDGNGL